MPLFAFAPGTCVASHIETNEVLENDRSYFSSRKECSFFGIRQIGEGHTGRCGTKAGSQANATIPFMSHLLVWIPAMTASDNEVALSAAAARSAPLLDMLPLQTVPLAIRSMVRVTKYRAVDLILPSERSAARRARGRSPGLKAPDSCRAHQQPIFDNPALSRPGRRSRFGPPSQISTGVYQAPRSHPSRFRRQHP
jgi:hypothetical protein